MQNPGYKVTTSPLAHLTAGLKPVSTTSGVALQDASLQARVGFRGRQAAGWLELHGYQVPVRANQATLQKDGSLVVRLSASEFMLLADSAASQQSVQQLEAGWQLSDIACYLLPRQDTHAWLRLRGPDIAAMMAKLCAVDLSAAAFPAGAVAQTSVARANSIVVNATKPGESAEFWLLIDSSLAAWFWEACGDAMTEFAGQYLPQ
ncbi:hypothetical protein [Pantoea sp. A4]|uniref:hypothetical protein n=1 Tax=Pantoea sp. A4 TaxID=1225184 RepID=UPI00037509EF|nr:hypothetical protein [Pantoea sp. A4]